MADAEPLPPLRDSVRYIRALGRPTVAQVLDEAQALGRTAIQPRCGVGGHPEMTALLRALEAGAAPDILSVTIDSHTRLKRFAQARQALAANPRELNGYPLVAHGWRRGRQLTEAVAAPLEVRHGSPEAELLFETAVASGITSFEGGGISYNLPYSKSVPLADSLRSWAVVDRRCGELADLGVVVDRELFGTLTAVLVPPSVSLAVSVLEAVLASRAGVRCLSIAYPQGGNLVQDVAALRAVPVLAERYLDPQVRVHAVLHEFMGVFPRRRSNAEDLILYGALTARLGGASKVVVKTYREAYGVPDAQANVAGLRLADRANSPLLGFLAVEENLVRQELDWILAETAELVDPVLAAPDTEAAIIDAFARGTLDIPFSASRQARSEVIPKRGPDGAIRYLSVGGLPLSRRSVRRNLDLLGGAAAAEPDETVFEELARDVNYFPDLFGEDGASAREGDRSAH